MSKHVRVPAPIQKIIPRIIRSATGRLILIAGSCAAVLALGGNHFLLSRATVTPNSPKTTNTKAPADAKVLGSATTEHLDEPSAPAPNTTPQPTADQKQVVATTTTQKDTNAKEREAASFEIEVDTSKITRQRQTLGLLLTIPFHVERHGGLSTPIVPGDVSVTSGGLLISTQVGSNMLTADSGVLTVLPLNIGSGTLNFHFSASSGNIVASAPPFSYKL